MITRNQFYKSIEMEIAKYSDEVTLYGSFLNDAFHFDETTQSTFSDIDLYCKQKSKHSRRSTISRGISDSIYKETGLTITTSVREERIHTLKLTARESWAVNCLESFYKLIQNNSFDYRVYHSIKFLLRTLYPEQYFDKRFTLESLSDDKETRDCLRFIYLIKRGQYSAESIEEVLSLTRLLREKNTVIYSLFSLMLIGIDNDQMLSGALRSLDIISSGSLELRKDFERKIDDMQILATNSQQLSTWQNPSSRTYP